MKTGAQIAVILLYLLGLLGALLAVLAVAVHEQPAVILLALLLAAGGFGLGQVVAQLDVLRKLLIYLGRRR